MSDADVNVDLDDVPGYFDFPVGSEGYNLAQAMRRNRDAQIADEAYEARVKEARKIAELKSIIKAQKEDARLRKAAKERAAPGESPTGKRKFLGGACGAASKRVCFTGAQKSRTQAAISKAKAANEKERSTCRPLVRSGTTAFDSDDTTTVEENVEEAPIKQTARSKVPLASTPRKAGAKHKVVSSPASRRKSPGKAAKKTSQYGDWRRLKFVPGWMPSSDDDSEFNPISKRESRRAPFTDGEMDAMFAAAAPFQYDLRQNWLNILNPVAREARQAAFVEAMFTEVNHVTWANNERTRHRWKLWKKWGDLKCEFKRKVKEHHERYGVSGAAGGPELQLNHGEQLSQHFYGPEFSGPIPGAVQCPVTSAASKASLLEEQQKQLRGKGEAKKAIEKFRSLKRTVGGRQREPAVGKAVDPAEETDESDLEDIDRPITSTGKMTDPVDLDAPEQLSPIEPEDSNDSDVTTAGEQELPHVYEDFSPTVRDIVNQKVVEESVAATSTMRHPKKSIRSRPAAVHQAQLVPTKETVTVDRALLEQLIEGQKALLTAQTNDRELLVHLTSLLGKSATNVNTMAVHVKSMKENVAQSNVTVEKANADIAVVTAQQEDLHVSNNEVKCKLDSMQELCNTNFAKMLVGQTGIKANISDMQGSVMTINKGVRALDKNVDACGEKVVEVLRSATAEVDERRQSDKELVELGEMTNTNLVSLSCRFTNLEKKQNSMASEVSDIKKHLAKFRNAFKFVEVGRDLKDISTDDDDGEVNEVKDKCAPTEAKKILVFPEPENFVGLQSDTGNGQDTEAADELDIPSDLGPGDTEAAIFTAIKEKVLEEEHLNESDDLLHVGGQVVSETVENEVVLFDKNAGEKQEQSLDETIPETQIETHQKQQEHLFPRVVLTEKVVTVTAAQAIENLKKLEAQSAQAAKLLDSEEDDELIAGIKQLETESEKAAKLLESHEDTNVVQEAKVEKESHKSETKREETVQEKKKKQIAHFIRKKSPRKLKPVHRFSPQ